MVHVLVCCGGVRLVWCVGVCGTTAMQVSVHVHCAAGAGVWMMHSQSMVQMMCSSLDVTVVTGTLRGPCMTAQHVTHSGSMHSLPQPGQQAIEPYAAP